MYRIKPHKGYNVLINDLGIRLDAEQDWKYIAKEAFDSSSDAQSVKDVLHIEDASKVTKPAKPAKVLEESHGIAEVAPKAFVARKEIEGVSSDIFVAQPQETTEVKEVEVKAEEVAPTVEVKAEEVTTPVVAEDENAAKNSKKTRGQKK